MDILRFLNRKTFKKTLPAMTLAELLIVLVIIGILALLAYPMLMPLISKTHSTEAQLQLQHLQTMEKTWFYMHSKYSADLKEISFEQSKLTTERGNANYKIEMISAGSNAFMARATAVVDFDGDGIFNVWEVDQDNNLKEITAD